MNFPSSVDSFMLVISSGYLLLGWSFPILRAVWLENIPLIAGIFDRRDWKDVLKVPISKSIEAKYLFCAGSFSKFCSLIYFIECWRQDTLQLLPLVGFFSLYLLNSVSNLFYGGNQFILSAWDFLFEMWASVCMKAIYYFLASEFMALYSDI